MGPYALCISDPRLNLTYCCFYTGQLYKRLQCLMPRRSRVGDLAREPTSTNFLLNLNDIYVTYLIDFVEIFVIAWAKQAQTKALIILKLQNTNACIKAQMHP